MSKTRVMMDNDTPIYVINTWIKNVESYNYLGQRYSTRDKTKTRRFKEESRPDGQHSPSTATSSRVTLEHAWRDKSTTHWKPYERKRPRRRPVRRWRDELDDFWKGTIWQWIAQDGQMWKQHAENFAQPRDTMAAQ